MPACDPPDALTGTATALMEVRSLSVTFPDDLHARSLSFALRLAVCLRWALPARQEHPVA